MDTPFTVSPKMGRGHEPRGTLTRHFYANSTVFNIESTGCMENHVLTHVLEFFLYIWSFDKIIIFLGRATILT